MQDSFALVREVQATRPSANLLELHAHRDSKVKILLSHEVGVVRLDRTFSNNSSSGVQGARSTSWLRYGRTKPSVATSQQGKQGSGGAQVLVRGCSSKPQEFRESKVCRALFGRVETPRTPVKESSTLCCLCTAVVREGSRRFSGTTMTSVVASVTRQVRYGRTTLNSRDKTLHALLAQYCCVSRRFAVLEPPRTSA